MDDLKDIFDRASSLLEGKKIVALMSKKAYINNRIGMELKDIIGWDVKIRADDRTCFDFFVAQKPNIGMTKPVQINCPLGIRPFKSFKIEIEEALKLFKEATSRVDCGDAFTAIELSWPLVPGVEEPFWHFRVLDHEIIIGANTGTTSSCATIKELLTIK